MSATSASTPSNSFAPLAYAVPEAAKVLGVSQAFVWQRVAKGDIKATRLGRRTLIPRAELERVVAEGF